MTIAEEQVAGERFKMRRFTTTEYYSMGEQGFFENERVQLIDGEIIVMSPQKSPHALTMEKLTRLFSRAIPDEFRLRVQLPLSLRDNSEPEPDIAIVKGDATAPGREHPITAELVIEVSDSTLRLDRRKANLYASANIVEYWIIDLAARMVHIHTSPVLDDGEKFGAKYGKVQSIAATAMITPVAVPMGTIKVADLLPSQ